ncbi:electron transport complex, RnfABCDGE type, G subunit [Thioploca ingrica]|uniref:Ion-translocating oxidoreductase complex subunit G n=1 Tax=Thioploca ingrica TaxID=40754 RepID=A0A090AEN0_9GAMM|nr:electron transport complex, RnfABCDGE type, G subunit [Thioploca ingrica]
MLEARIIRVAAILTLFAILGSGLVTFTYQITAPHIAANERATLLRTLNALISQDQYDNDLFNDFIWVQNEDLLGTNQPVTLYRARQAEQPVAVLLTPVAPDGYNGAIRLLVGINYNGTLLGVRVISHQETPGLGDYIETRRSNWILDFKGRSLTNPSESGWRVKRDGGVFDQVTGATITPRAVVKAVHKALLFYQQQRNALFNKDNPSS